MTRLRLLALACLLAAASLIVTAAPRQDVVTAYLSDINGRPPRLAIPDFLGTGTDADLKAAARTIADVLWDDLDFEEEFYMLPPDVARSVPPAAADKLVRSGWEQRGADYVLVGSVRRSGNDIPIDIHVITVATGKDVLPKSYGCQLAYVRTCAHTIADSVHKNLRNRDGVAMTRLAFASDRGGDIASNVPPRVSKEIYISDYDGANPMPVTNNHRLNHSPAWSPDGRLLAYVSNLSGPGDIYVKSVYEAKQAWRPAGGPPSAENFAPAFSPDGLEIAFHSNRDGTYQIYVVPVDGKNAARRITSTKTYEQNPVWSPNGSQIIFMSDRAGQGSPRLYQMNADGTGQDALNCGNGCAHPSWSPVGTDVVFTCGNVIPFNICMLTLRTGQVQPLLPNDGHSNEQPVFAPNGKHIAFKTNRYGKDEIAIMDLKGKIQRRVTNTGNNSYPSWSRSK